MTSAQMSGEDRDDEKRTFLSLLPGTLDALCSLRTAPHDDTILHRLVDIIKQLGQFQSEKPLYLLLHIAF